MFLMLFLFEIVLVDLENVGVKGKDVWKIFDYDFVEVILMVYV